MNVSISELARYHQNYLMAGINMPTDMQPFTHTWDKPCFSEAEMEQDIRVYIREYNKSYTCIYLILFQVELKLNQNTKDT